MADLSYSLDELVMLSDGLKTLSSQLSHDGGLKDVGLEDVAHQLVIDAIELFADDWDNKREELANNVQKISEMAQKAEESFRGTDEDLAKKVKEILNGGGS